MPGVRPRVPVRRWRIGTVLLWLVFACLLPVVLGSAVMLAREYRNGRAQLERDTIATARAMVQAVDGRLLRVRTAAEVLAASDALGRNDLAAFHRRARELIAATKVGMNVVISDASGQQLLNTLREYGDPLPRHGNPELLRRVFATGQAAVSDIYLGGVLRLPVLSVDAPVKLDGKVRYVLSIGLMPSDLNDVLVAQNFPAAWVSAIFDSTGTIVARTHAAEKFVGQKGTAEYIQRIRESPEGAMKTVTREGIPTLSVWSRSPVTGWSVGIGIPNEVLERGLIGTLAWLAAGMTIVIGVGVGLAWWTGRDIAASIRALAVPAAALGRGETVAIPAVDIQESAEVLAAIEQAAELLSQRTAQMEAAHRELEDFSYSMSHDMRSPLRALDGYSKILLDEHGAGLDGEGRRLLEILRGNAKRMGRLIDDILHFLSLGKRRLKSGTVDVARLATEIFAQLQAELPQRKLRLDIGELPPARGDAEMIHLLLANLMSNAVKFSSADAEALIEIRGAAGENENVYSVRDCGVGFDMRYAHKLFRVFERLHPMGRYEGSAIGLAIVRRIVERHGGRVWAEGSVGEGATFHFSLPARDRSGADEPAAPGIQLHRASGGTTT